MKKCENCGSENSVQEYQWGQDIRMLCSDCADKIKNGTLISSSSDAEQGVIVSGVFAAIAYTVLIIGLITGFWLGDAYPVINMISEELSESFNWFLALKVWLGSVMLFAVLYGISLILKNQEIMLEKLKQKR